MNLFKNIKAHFEQKPGSFETDVRFTAEIAKQVLEHCYSSDFRREVARVVAEQFYEKHEQQLRELILKDKKFMPAVYNTIVSRTAADYPNH